ncbi:MAG: hypothetical protein MK198_06765 [Gracilimonas sp.]|uniref:hypothetical protein n=1 Tax=Gracilimonas sp. TaxID=1974203 RepID=UPI0037504D41|nr:hypothetical protein [Gracilimonas sp.]
MYRLDTLKENIEISKDTIECPVRGCRKSVPRKRRGNTLTKEEITCPDHNIEIRSTTFIYPRKEDNLLWSDNADVELLNKIEGYKRESRMENDNSEDAVTWNVFRYLDKNNLITELVGHLTGNKETVEDLIYWSYSVKQVQQWDLLKQAQDVFGEQENRGSEPDMAIETERSIIFIEAKFNAGNETIPSNPEESLPKYSEGGNHWSRKVFSEPLEKVALQRKRYELMRFWLLGSWMANQRGKDFYLINLVKNSSRENLENTFKPSIIESKESHIRLLKRVNWEDIYELLEEQNMNDKALKSYFHNKISGYSSDGKIKKAFSVKS